MHLLCFFKHTTAPNPSKEGLFLLTFIRDTIYFHARNSRITKEKQFVNRPRVPAAGPWCSASLRSLLPAAERPASAFLIVPELYRQNEIE
jgi:hypothetical protein